jgi:hypothetical protein
MKILISISEVVNNLKNGLYSAVYPEPPSKKKLTEFCKILDLSYKDQGVHCTVMYAKENKAREEDASQFILPKYRAHASKVTWWEGHDKEGYLVLLLESEDLQKEHTRLRKAGSTPTYQEYRPHITLCSPCEKPGKYKIKLANLSLRRNPFSLVLSNQMVEPLKSH